MYVVHMGCDHLCYTTVFARLCYNTLTNSNIQPFRALYCFSSDTLQQVLLTFATEQIHRLYIVNENKQLLGVITLSDIIDVLDRLDLDM